jgi:hypothetical protein
LVLRDWEPSKGRNIRFAIFQLFLTYFEGACNGIWRSLEFFFHSGFSTHRCGFLFSSSSIAWSSCHGYCPWSR